MDKFKWFGVTGGGNVGERVPVLLSKDTCLTERGKWSSIVNFEASDKILSNKLLQSIMANVA